ncbi:MAG: VanW family protein [Candidatus Andersenbacteria bacterium]
MAKKKGKTKKKTQDATWYLTAAIIAVVVVGGALLTTPLVFADRIAPGLKLGSYDLSGVSEEDLDGVLLVYEQDLLKTEVAVELQGKQTSYSLEQLGLSLNHGATKKKIRSYYRPLGFPVSQVVQPVLALSQVEAHAVLHDAYAAQLELPQNATLREAAGNTFELVRGVPGEQVDIVALREDLQRYIADMSKGSGSFVPLELTIISAAPPVQDSEVGQAKQLAETLLRDGLTLSYGENTYEVKQFTIRRLLTFGEQVDPRDPANVILGVRFDPLALRTYLETTLQPDIDQEPVNAKFEVAQEETLPEGIRVTQFAIPQIGRQLNLSATVESISEAIASGQTRAALAVDETQPEIAQAEDITELGVTTLLARGESDFVGSPANRIHNISVGASKYHGLLIAPGEEFSFNKYLGPVTGAAGFKPELVIKQNVTVPEFGGGLCQVSTTAFRAAAHSGMEITERKNHSYAVAYYGTPGFDATIYPGYTDFRFLNNTPGHILIQTKVVGTKLYFEFWGTDDGREVEVIGPNPYNRQPDGAVKATLTQKVIRYGQVVLEDEFYSNYRSPKLYPKAVAQNGEQQST